MDINQFSILDKKMDVLIGLLTLDLTKGQTLQDRAELLNSLGLTSSQIARALGKTPNNIDQALHKARKKNKVKKMSEMILNEIKSLLEDIKGLLILTNQEKLEKRKTDLLTSGSIEEKVYNLCNGKNEIGDISKKLGKAEKIVRARISDLRRKGLIKSLHQDEKYIHLQIF